jgi:hypothetical protein
VSLASLLLAKQRRANSAPRSGASALLPQVPNSRSARVLICAPSNAAVDEIVMRIRSQGLVDDTGKRFEPAIVRLGALSSVTIETVKEYCLDQISDEALRAKQAAMNTASHHPAKYVWQPPLKLALSSRMSITTDL